MKRKQRTKKKENEDEKTLNPDDVVTIGNEEVSIKELIDTYKNSCKNEDKDDKENEEKEEDKENEEEDKKDNEDDKKKDNEDEEKKNQLTNAVKQYINQAIRNALKNEDEKKDNEDKDEKMNSLSIASMMRDFGVFETKYQTRADRIEESNKKYSLE